MIITLAKCHSFVQTVSHAGVQYWNCDKWQWRTQEILFGGGGGGVQPRNFLGGSTNSVEDRERRERGYGGGSLLVRGSGGSYNLVQEISFHIVKKTGNSTQPCQNLGFSGGGTPPNPLGTPLIKIERFVT
jgi:hypothetical protein